MAAEYTIETVNLIRELSNAGKGAHAIAAVLGWTLSAVLNVAKRHSVSVNIESEEFLRTSKVPKEKASPAVSAPAATTRKRPYGSNTPRGKLAAHPRSEYTTVSISKAAKAAIAAEMDRTGRALSSAAGLVLDYIARHGDFAALLDKAIAEVDAP